jgi:DNA helicase HerA-like ATPase
MDRPRLYSTFVLWMLAQLYEQLPEMGDLPKPRLAFFFDEAHLLFKDASDALMEQIERTARLIRSKGVGVYFVTQSPTDVPSSVLSQLGNRVQHALRAFTPEDADALRKAARTFPMTEHYDVERTLTSLGIGEAFITVLNAKGVPTPLAATRLVPPDSRMAPLTPEEIAALVAASPFAARYNAGVDRESAHEIITSRLTNAKAAAATAAAQAQLRNEVSPTTADGLRTMTPAQRQREINRRARELETARKAAERERKAREKQAAAMARERERTMRATVNTVGKVIGSRGTQSLLRGVFDTIFGGGRR